MINYKENLDVNFLDNEFDFAELLEKLNEQFQIHWFSKFFSWSTEIMIWEQCSEHALWFLKCNYILTYSQLFILKNFS